MQEAYAEVNEILNLMDEQYIKKIPIKVINLIRNEMSKEYQPRIDVNIPLKNQNLKRETFLILAVLNLNYWCKDEDEKRRLLQYYSEVDVSNKEKFAVNNVFNNKNVTLNNANNTCESLVKHEEKFFTRLMNRIKKIFK